MYHMSHRAHGFADVSNEGEDLTSDPQTLEVMVLAWCQALGNPYIALSLLSYQLRIFLLRRLAKSY